MKFWGKLLLEDRILKDLIKEGGDLKGAVAELCAELDLSKPLILDKHIAEMRQFGRTVFYPDDFIEPVAFDSFEIEKIAAKKKI